MLRQGFKWLFCSLIVPAMAFAAEAGHEAEAAHGGENNIFAGDWILVILTLAIFIVLLIVLGKWAWKPILSGLQKREEYIRQSIEEAEKAKTEADKSMAEYTQKLADAKAEAQEIIEKGRADAQRLSDELKQKAQDDAQSMRKQAESDIASAKDQAIKELYQQVTFLATDMAGGIVRKSLNADDHQQLLQDSLSKLQNESNN